MSSCVVQQSMSSCRAGVVVQQMRRYLDEGGSKFSCNTYFWDAEITTSKNSFDKTVSSSLASYGEAYQVHALPPLEDRHLPLRWIWCEGDGKKWKQQMQQSNLTHLFWSLLSGFRESSVFNCNLWKAVFWRDYANN